MKIMNPSTSQVIQDIAEDTFDSLQKKFASMTPFAPTASATAGNFALHVADLDRRLHCIEKFVGLLSSKDERDLLAHTLTSEVGKPLQESHNEINGTLQRIQFFLTHAKKVLAPKKVNQAGNTAEHLSFRPLGKILSIGAWNYPFLTTTNVHIPALIAGNAVLFKPSEYATLSGMHWHRLLLAAGIPAQQFQIAIGGPEVGKMMTKLTPAQGVFFTGSFETGDKIASSLPNRLIPMGMELGGKDPLYVRSDVANIDRVAASAVEGAFYNNGQSCCAVERIYVHAKVYPQFLESFVAHAKKLTVGSPLLESTTQGPLTRPSHIALLQAHTADAVEKKGELLLGGATHSAGPQYFSPTVIAAAHHGMRMMKEESFGPIIGIQKVESDEEAVRLMQDTEYGLTAAIYTSDIARAEALLEQINTGTGYINCCDRVSPFLPWSGQNHSGLGHTLSELGILSFVKPYGLHSRTV